MLALLSAGMTYAALALIWFLHFVPLPILTFIGTGIGECLYWLVFKRRHIVHTNLALCFPELSVRTRRWIAHRHFHVFAVSVLERGVFWWAPEARLRRLIQIDPVFPLTEMSQRTTIVLCPHFVSLEAAGMAMLLNQRGATIYTEQRNRIVDAQLRRGRMRFLGGELFSRNAGVRPILRTLKQGVPYFMLPDMDFGTRDAVFVDFFGVPTATLTALGRIAQAAHAQVIPVIATRRAWGRGWRVQFLPAWQHFPETGEQADQLNARRMNAFIEAHIRAAPHEYYWMHKRFKTRPVGIPDVYTQAQ